MKLHSAQCHKTLPILSYLLEDSFPSSSLFCLLLLPFFPEVFKFLILLPSTQFLDFLPYFTALYFLLPFRLEELKELNACSCDCSVQLRPAH
jgi:hypothetical protein